jgi:serine/threonine protein kinase
MEATMETEHHLCIVLEYVKGGELFDFVQRMHGRLHVSDQDMVDEQMIKRLSLELIQIVDWLHHHNIVHRDLKLESNYMHDFFLFIYFILLTFIFRYSCLF